MRKSTMTVADYIQFGILTVMGICALAGFWAYCENHFALASAYQATDAEVNHQKGLLGVMHDQLLRLEFVTGADKVQLDPQTKKPIPGSGP